MDGGGRLLKSVVGPRRTGASGAPVLPVMDVGTRPRRRFGFRRGSVGVPLERRLPAGLGWWLTASFFLGVGTLGVIQGDQMPVFRAHYGEPHHAVARLFGFGIEKVVISGIAELKEGEVMRATGISPIQALPFIDVDAMQARLEALPLVKEASVRKLYPDEISITLVERKPFALWQNQGDIFVIAADGTVIDSMQDERFLGLPFVVGEGANERVGEYVQLLDHAGPLRSHILAASLVSGRRWNLKLDNGMTVALPENDTGAAVERLVALEKNDRVLDRDVMALDLRQSDRITLRLTEEAASARADALKKKPKAPGSNV